LPLVVEQPESAIAAKTEGAIKKKVRSFIQPNQYQQANYRYCDAASS